MIASICEQESLSADHAHDLHKLSEVTQVSLGVHAMSLGNKTSQQQQIAA
jgi:hypothetical protein